MTTTPEQHSSRGLGKGMLIAAWIIVLLLLTWFFNNHLAKQHNPNQQLSSTGPEPVVQLERNRFGHYVASGTINGKDVVFMLDTGASDVSVPEPLANRIGLQKGRASVYQTANGSIRVWQTLINEVRLGNIRVKNVKASINPASQGNKVLLGMSFLKHLDFNQQGNTLTLKYPETH